MTNTLRKITLMGLTALALASCSGNEKNRAKEENDGLPQWVSDSALHYEAAGITEYREAERTKNKLSIKNAIENLENARRFLPEGARWCAATYRVGNLYLMLGSTLASTYISQLEGYPECSDLTKKLKQSQGEQN